MHDSHLHIGNGDIFLLKPRRSGSLDPPGSFQGIKRLPCLVQQLADFLGRLGRELFIPQILFMGLLTQDQTLVIESGHPLGLFRSKPDAPRVIITNAMMVGLYDNQKDWHVAMQMGVANYGQMTAGGWM